MDRYKRDWIKNRLLCGLRAIVNPDEPDPFGATKHMRYYWKKRIKTPGWHEGSHGGARNVKFTEDQRRGLHFLIHKKLIDAPHTSFSKLVSYAKSFGYNISKPELSALLKKWRWSAKVPSEEQIQKYSIKNIEYYGDYVLEILNLPWYRIKYLDESHFRASGEKIEF